MYLARAQVTVVRLHGTSQVKIGKYTNFKYITGTLFYENCISQQSLLATMPLDYWLLNLFIRTGVNTEIELVYQPYSY